MYQRSGLVLSIQTSGAVNTRRSRYLRATNGVSDLDAASPNTY